MRKRYTILIGFTACLAMPALAQSETPEMRAGLSRCFEPARGTAPATIIADCTALLGNPSWSAVRLSGIHMSRGNAYDAMGAAADALADYDQAIAIDPGKALYYYNRGIFHVHRHEVAAAQADFQDTVRLDASIAPAHFYLGSLALQAGDFPTAVTRLSEAIALSPKMAEAYLQRAAAEGKLGEQDKTVADLQMAIRLDPVLAGRVQMDGKPLR